MPAFHISTTYPSNDGVGFSKFRVPAIPTCLPVPVSTTAGCSIIGQETYKGILLGDINGNFSSVGSGGTLRTAAGSSVVFDLTNSVAGDGYVTIPVSIVTEETVNSLDFAMQFAGSNVQFNSVVDNANYLQSLSNVNADDNTLRYTSYSLQNYEVNKSVVSVRVASANGQISESDFSSIEAYLNGEPVKAELLTARNSSTSMNQQVSVYPNPTTGIINVISGEDADVQIMDLSGSTIVLQTNVNANQKHEINLQSLANGIYMIRISNGNFVSMKKLVVNK
ncbi:MAG: T9SS type A sorting domain-containing protein [Bacteroidetes bacterium]|nr:T9SS type A sorting domain-containing protein [Bacteroidota bacterium]